MKAEIGSNFWEYCNEKIRDSKFWWENYSSVYYYKSGRNAVKAVCKELSSQYSKIMLPAYLCETEIEPWEESNWDISYYSVNSDFSVTPTELAKAIKKNKPQVLYIQNYFGFDTMTVRCKEILRKAKDENIIIIEDITQSILSDFRCEYADYYVASFRKFFAIPDGGVVITQCEFKEQILKKADINIENYSRYAYSLKAEYFETMDKCTKEEFRKYYVLLNNLISINDDLYEMSNWSKIILQGIDIENIKKKRNRNYKYLFEGLKSRDIGEMPLIVDSDNNIPLFLPILVNTEKKDRLNFRHYLAENDIYCPIIWQHPMQVPKEYNSVEKIYDSILCFPIDQRYDESDMERILTTIDKWNCK